MASHINEADAARADPLGVIGNRRPLFWRNPGWTPAASAFPTLPLGLNDIEDAAARLARMAPLVARLFPETAPANGIIESDLAPIDRFARALKSDGAPGRWLLKCDHALPIAGSIKARGGIYEVLHRAEQLALAAGVLGDGSDWALLAGPDARNLFARHAIAVGSTGNLGLSIGIMARALGFRTIVHMSSDAKVWKKQLLRDRGAEVVEHDGDYERAVAEGRRQAQHDPQIYFVDDEGSQLLLLGYAVAALRLRGQLGRLGLRVDAVHPLFVYLPCGVGGAPAGITLGLRALFGDDVHCVFAEPVAAPCMLVRLASASDRLSAYDFGLDNRTEADGLAVARASELAAQIAMPLAAGVYTVSDAALLANLYRLERTEGLRIEPSAAAGLCGPAMLCGSAGGRAYIADHGLGDQMANATHIAWSTGGALAPPEQFAAWRARGEALARG
jgi:D-serine dehydratase